MIMPSGGQNIIPFEQDIADALCAWISEGNSLKSWCETKPKSAKGKTITASVVYRWLQTEEKFELAYARAREDRADTLVEDMLDIADNADDDAYIRYVDGKPVAAIDGTSIRRAEVMIKTRQWIAEKMKPAHYGARLDLTSGGRAIGAPIKDAAERLAQILLAAQKRAAGEDVPALTVDAHFVDALPAPAVPSLDDMLS